MFLNFSLYYLKINVYFKCKNLEKRKGVDGIKDRHVILPKDFLIH